MKQLNSERLVLRDFCAGDADDFYEYVTSDSFGPSIGWKNPETRDESDAMLSELVRCGEWYAIELVQENRLIGSVGVHHDGKRNGVRSRSLSYSLNKNYEGKGYITEAVKRVIASLFEDQDCDAVACYHYPFNSASKRVIEKCGFVYEGIIRSADRIYDGNTHDEVCYSILRDEYYNELREK